MAAKRYAGPRMAIGIDVGGSGIKGAIVNVDKGVLVGERIRVLTPEPSTPKAVVEAIAELVGRLVADSAAGADAVAGLPVGVGFPAAVIDGVTLTAANVDKGWINYPAEEKLGQAVGRSVAVANDADVAGLAEVRFGAGAGKSGVVMVLTVGTGIGSGLFVDGKLVPNTELGHLEMRGKDAETRASDAARNRRQLTWDQWAKVFNEYLLMIERLFWPHLIILGGGTSKRADKFLSKLTVRAPVVPAQLLNDAGIVGAALVAAERFGGKARERTTGAARENGRAPAETVTSSTEIA